MFSGVGGVGTVVKRSPIKNQDMGAFARPVKKLGALTTGLDEFGGGVVGGGSVSWGGDGGRTNSFGDVGGGIG